MSVIQSTQKEVRFLKRKNLEEEARVLGNMYADQIRMFGIDCIYHKLNTKIFGDFKNIIDKNTKLIHAYKGYNINPDYTCSAEMITYPEIQQDIFNLQKYGIRNEAEIDFYFDSKQFACDLATKCGQLKEYPISSIDIDCEVPDVDSQTSTDVFPYRLGLGYKEFFMCDMLSGKLSVDIWPYEYDKQYMLVCNPYEHTDFKVSFLKNSDLYKSLEYEIFNDDYVDSLIYLSCSVHKTVVAKDNAGNDITKNILHGKITGSLLFYDIHSIGKYLELIHPEVGDVITIDFPDEKNREKYEITDCYDKNLQNDGISPLLHKYIWKCKARRYVPSYEENTGLEENEADKRMDEKLIYDQVVEEEVAKKISKYDQISGDIEEDAVYGGYDGVIRDFDQTRPDPAKHEKYDIMDDDLMTIMKFGCGCRLATDGYELLFIDVDQNAYKMTLVDYDHSMRLRCYESSLKWLKATDSQIVFINVEGEPNMIVEDEVATKNEMEICLDDLREKSIDFDPVNKENDNIFKFKNSRSYLWATKHHLFAKLESNKQMYKLI